MEINIILKVIDECLKNNPCKIEIRYNEPMKDHTTFKAGGPADCLIQYGYGEGFPAFCCDLLKSAKIKKVPVFILGGGANIVVSDKGIRGIVLDMSAWKDSAQTFIFNEEIIIFKSGTKIDDAVNAAAENALEGLEFLAGMPGTIGGAVWMNARCYGSEISDVLDWVEIITSGGRAADNSACAEPGYYVTKMENKNSEGFGYKQSPFQKMDCIILNAAFKTKKGDKNIIYNSIDKYKNDRKEKGHYLFPSAGSVFKNSREHGKPAGQIIDECGLKGLKKGGAQIAAFHGNFIINAENASASDIRALTEETAAKVKSATGLILEPEILFIGDW